MQSVLNIFSLLWASKLRSAAVLVITAADILVTYVPVDETVKQAAHGVLTAGAALGIVPLHLEVLPEPGNEAE